MNKKLKIVDVESVNFQFQKSPLTDYVKVICSDEDGVLYNTAITHKALTNNGIKEPMFRKLQGTVVTVKDSADRDSGVVETAEERLENVANGTYNILTLNASNCSVLASELLETECKEYSAVVEAKVKVEMGNQKKLDALKRVQERMALKATAVSTPTETATLETNENPF